MDIDQYYKKLNVLAIKINDLGCASQDFLHDEINKNNQTIFDLISFRKEFIDDNDYNKVRGLLISGHFAKFNENERIACFIMTFEIDEIKSKISWRRKCELYDKSQPLFKREPHLFDSIRRKSNGAKDLELLDILAFTQLNNSEIIRINNTYSKIDGQLNSLLFFWAKENFKGKLIFVRVNPYAVYHEVQMQMIFESVQMPANQNWWKNLTIYNKNKEGASYILDDCSPVEDYQQYWELHIKGIQRLEVIAKRNNKGNLSMMIEEITSIDNHGLRLGRMIHLDTDSPYGTDFNNATLNHLDLAINVYDNEAAISRGTDNLSSGNKTVDATYRTHLLRIEDIPFKALFGFATSFFKSQTLIKLWFEDQFQKTY